MSGGIYTKINVEVSDATKRQRIANLILKCKGGWAQYEVIQPSVILSFIDIEVGPYATTYPLTILTANDSWTIEQPSITEWVSIDPMSGNGELANISFLNNDGSRLRIDTINFICGDAIPIYLSQNNIELSLDDISIDDKEAEFDITVITVDRSWVIENANMIPGWIQFSVLEGKGITNTTLTIDRNYEEESRSATITFKRDKSSTQLKIKQAKSSI